MFTRKQAGVGPKPIFSVALLNTERCNMEVKIKERKNPHSGLYGRLSLCTLVKVAEQCA